VQPFGDRTTDIAAGARYQRRFAAEIEQFPRCWIFYPIHTVPPPKSRYCPTMPGKAKPRPEVWTAERCWITELLNSASQPEVSLARTRVEPGVTTQLHQLSVSEWYVIESGHGLMRVGDETPVPVGPGDTVSIPKHTPQQITNSGHEDLRFLCVCTPKFSQECYTSLE
jgi:mannose-6-phosphate isomerase-like protein (cupin superfamily)